MNATTTPTPAAAANGTPAPEAKTPLERLTEAMDANPLDFNAWTQLIALLESDVRLGSSRASPFRILTVVVIIRTCVGVSGARAGRVDVRPLPGRVPAVLWLLEQGK